MSKNGPGFRAANGTEIKHLGQRRLKGQGDRFNPISVTAQVAEVKTALASVHQMLKSGNKVHFEPGNCYVQQMTTGKKTKIEEKNGTFEIGLWVPKSRSRSGAEVTGSPEIRGMVNEAVLRGRTRGSESRVCKPTNRRDGRKSVRRHVGAL